jgi:hypothetical protein
MQCSIRLAALPKTSRGLINPASRRILRMWVRNVSLPKGKSAFGYPILVESPAARITGAMDVTDRIVAPQITDFSETCRLPPYL